jgi:hypothetical protein
MPSPNRPTGPYQVVPDSDYLNRSIMVVCGPGGVRERIESAIEARRTCDIANIAHAAGKRAVEGDAILALKFVEWAGTAYDKAGDRYVCCPCCQNDGDMGHTNGCKLAAALASAGQEVKHGG